MCVWAPPHLKAVVLPEDAAVNRLDGDLVLHAYVQGFHSATGAEQWLMGARLLQPGHQMRSKRDKEEKERENWVTLRSVRGGSDSERGSICTVRIHGECEGREWEDDEAPLASKSTSSLHDKLAHFINTCSRKHFESHLLMWILICNSKRQWMNGKHVSQVALQTHAR